VAAFFWLLFLGCSKKSHSPSGRNNKQNKKPPVNANKNKDTPPPQTVALHKSPSIISPLKAVAMAAAFAFYAIKLPILNKFS